MNAADEVHEIDSITVINAERNGDEWRFRFWFTNYIDRWNGSHNGAFFWNTLRQGKWRVCGLIEMSHPITFHADLNMWIWFSKNQSLETALVLNWKGWMWIHRRCWIRQHTDSNINISPTFSRTELGFLFTKSLIMNKSNSPENHNIFISEMIVCDSTLMAFCLSLKYEYSRNILICNACAVAVK